MGFEAVAAAGKGSIVGRLLYRRHLRFLSPPIARQREAGIKPHFLTLVADRFGWSMRTIITS